MYIHKNNVKLCKLERFDIPSLIDLKNESWFGTHKISILNRQDQDRWFEKISDSHNDLVLTAYHVDYHVDDICRRIGIFKIFNIDWMNRSCEIGQDIFKDYRGQGFGDHLIKSYDNTYGFKSIIVRPSNNFGPKQHSEKLIPTIMRSIKEGKPVPVYGKGENIRDWLYVKDTTNAIKHLITNGVPGETYNITAKNEVKNIDLINSIFKIYKTLHGEGKAEIDFVKDRPGHDWRYSITNDKLIATGFEEFGNFNKQLIETIKWYMQKK